MIPVYDKGEYVLKVEPPPGWTFGEWRPLSYVTFSPVNCDSYWTDPVTCVEISVWAAVPFISGDQVDMLSVTLLRVSKLSRVWCARVSDPTSVEINIDGKTDQCSRGEDINFQFTGFGLVGTVRAATTGVKRKC